MNRMQFNVYNPNKIQIDMLSVISDELEDCNLFDKNEIYDVKNLYILTHPFIEMIINNKSVHIPLGYVHIEPFSYKFLDRHGNSYSVIYVHSRCSFGLSSRFKTTLKTISEVEKTKVNIGQILGLALNDIAFVYGQKMKTNYVILFNMSLTTAISKHKKNDWRLDVDDPFSQIRQIGTGITALDLFENKMKLIDTIEDNTMYKVIKIT